jgi:hypothetical protein
MNFLSTNVVRATTLTLLLSTIASISTQAEAQATLVFSPPLGYSNGLGHGSRVVYLDNNNDGNFNDLIETTAYRVQNPDLVGSSVCFQTPMSNLVHAGEDWYRRDGYSTAGADVTAIANGTVYNFNPAGDYPGEAVVLSHTLGNGRTIYSVYMHITGVTVAQGNSVVRGQKLGTVLSQPYSGNFPIYHPTDDSHLHFEMRYFGSAASIYTDHPTCNYGDAPGRGYVYTGFNPDTYPSASTGYTNPTYSIYTYWPYRGYQPFFVGGAGQDTFEPNDTSTTAATVGFDTWHNSFIWASSDVDWYKFSVSASSSSPKEIEVWLHNPLQGNYDLELYNPSSSLLAFSRNRADNNDEYIAYTATQSGSYKIKVSRYAGYSPYHSYSFKITTTTVPPFRLP